MGGVGGRADESGGAGGGRRDWSCGGWDEKGGERGGGGSGGYDMFGSGIFRTLKLTVNSMGEDLLWAISGGGGSFGVILAYKIELECQPEVVIAGSGAPHVCYTLERTKGHLNSSLPPSTRRREREGKRSSSLQEGLLSSPLPHPVATSPENQRTPPMGCCSCW